MVARTPYSGDPIYKTRGRTTKDLIEIEILQFYQVHKESCIPHSQTEKY